MSDRLSLGPVQVFGTSVEEINLALRLLSERIDEIKGLRGRAVIHDRVKVGDPEEEDDALNSPADDTVLPSNVCYDDANETITGAWSFNANVTVAASVTIDGVDISAHAGGTAKAQHTGGLGTHTHQSAGSEGGQLDHGAALTGLTDDDHAQYALLAGRSGGQTLKGGTASGDDLTLSSTDHATKGAVRITDGSAFKVIDANDTLLHGFGNL